MRRRSSSTPRRSATSTTNPVIAIDKIAQAQRDLLQAMATVDRLKEEGIQSARRNIATLAQMSAEMQGKLGGLQTGTDAEPRRWKRERGPSMKGLTKGLLGLVGAFALVGVVVWAWPLVIPPAPPAPASASPGTRLRQVRQQARAGRRRAGPVQISILTTDTKAEWLGAVTQDFNDARKMTAAGRPIQVEMLQVSGPDEMMQNVLEGSTLQPVLWSPGDVSWIDQANQFLKDQGQGEIVERGVPAGRLHPHGLRHVAADGRGAGLAGQADRLEADRGAGRRPAGLGQIRASGVGPVHVRPFAP